MASHSLLSWRQPGASAAWYATSLCCAASFATPVQLARSDLGFAGHAHRVRRDEIGPDPVMMLDDGFRREVRPITDRVAIGYDDHLVSECDSGTDAGIDAQIRGPSGDQQAFWTKLGQVRVQGGLEERVIQGLADEPIRWRHLDRAQQLPPWRVRLEFISRRA